MAEFVLKDMVEKTDRTREFVIESAATSTEEIGNPVYPPARRMLAKHGIGCAGKTARQIRRSDYSNFDLIIGMDDANMRNMARAFSGDPEGKLHLLMDYSEHPGRNVADPWYTGDFDATWRDVVDGCRGLLHSLENK
jgi:protein-tyrosine phosphatase